MKKLAAATPALFCLINLLFPVTLWIAKNAGPAPFAMSTNILFPFIAILAMLTAFVWFCYSFDHRADVHGVHVLFGIFAPTLAAINGLCFMLTAPTFWPCIFAVAMWISSLFIPAGCNDLRLGRGLRGVLTVAPGICVMLFAAIFMLSDRLF